MTKLKALLPKVYKLNVTKYEKNSTYFEAN